MERQANERDDKRERLCGKTLGDYRIERRIGGGATSDVFQAEQLSLRRPVALKILKDDLARDEIYVKRFLQEARAAARLEHPNIVRIYEVGELADHSERRSWKRLLRLEPSSSVEYHFIAQELIDGISLALYLRRIGRASIAQTIETLEQVASALKRASDLGIVHRDVKPENILIDSSGTLKVVDFGLARFIDANDADSWSDPSLTRAGVALGTPLYMSPEQARGQKIDARSDIYALGIVAYRMLTGEPPFIGDAPLAIVLKHLHEKPRSIASLRPDVPPALASLVERMIEKDPNDRPSSLSDALKELNAVKASLGQNAASERENIDFERSSASEESSSDTNASRGFLSEGQERETFERVARTTNVSRAWSVDCMRLEATKKTDRVQPWTRKRIVAAILLASGAALLGTALAAARDFFCANSIKEPPLSLRRLDSAEEQYVFAMQLETPDAWRGVVEYFPQEKYWARQAKRQLAVSYVDEKNVDEAEAIFKELEIETSATQALDPLAIAGLAWVAASRENYDGAAAAISELTDLQKNDGLTRRVLMRTRALMRRRVDELPRSFPREEQQFRRPRTRSFDERRDAPRRPNERERYLRDNEREKERDHGSEAFSLLRKLTLDV